MSLFVTNFSSPFRTVYDTLEINNLIVNNLTPGRTYKLRYAARNLVYDSGNMFNCDSIKWSPTVSVLTAVIP